MEDRAARTILMTALIGMTCLFLVKGCSIKIENERLRNDCTYEVTATVKGIETRMENDGEINMDPTVYQKPTFIFELNGKEERVTEDAFKVYEYKEGQSVTLMVNPDNPKEFYHKQYLTDLLAYAFMGAALFMTACIAVLHADNRRRVYERKRAKEPVDIYRESGYRYLRKR